MSCPYQERSGPFRICNAVQDASGLNIRNRWHSPEDVPDHSQADPEAAAREAGFLFESLGVDPLGNPYADALLSEIRAGERSLTRGNVAVMRRIALEEFTNADVISPAFGADKNAIDTGQGVGAVGVDDSHPLDVRVQTLYEESIVQVIDKDRGLLRVSLRQIEDSGTGDHALWEAKLDHVSADGERTETWVTDMKLAAMRQEPDGEDAMRVFRSWVTAHGSSEVSGDGDLMPWGRENSRVVAGALSSLADADDYSYDEPYGMSDVEADADTLASAGMGTDEDYGYYGDQEYEPEYGSDW